MCQGRRSTKWSTAHKNSAQCIYTRLKAPWKALRGPLREGEEEEMSGGSGDRWLIPTIFGLAGAVVGLRQVALHTAAGVRALCVGTGLAAGPVHTALVKIWPQHTVDVTHGTITG